MADRYIDHEETLLYGPYAARKIKAVALGLHPKFDPALTYLADEIMDATQAMDRALQKIHAKPPRPKPPKPVKAAATEVVTADGNPSP